MRSVILIRLVMAWIFIFEGGGKLFGWFGGSGIERIAGYFAKLGIPFATVSAYLVGCLEFISGILFLAGVLVRPAAAAIAVIMVTAIFTAHRDSGFNYPLLVLAASVLLIEAPSGFKDLWRKQ